MTRRSLNQFLESASIGDATTDHALLIRRWLLEMGFDSEIFAEHCHPRLDSIIKPASAYRQKSQNSLILYHHGIGAAAAERLLKSGQPLILIYHNITPVEYFTSADPSMAGQMKLGRKQLTALCKQTKLALAASSYSETELQDIGYSPTGVLPIVLDEEQYRLHPSHETLLRYQDRGPILLFVGRLAPNKKQEDLIKLLHYYRRIESEAILLLVGGPFPPSYARWLNEFSSILGLESAVTFTGHVSHREMITYYQLADLFISMSEHEGFGKPLIESMYFKLPVAAYKAAAVPYTMAKAGMLFQHKNFEALAELVDLLITDLDLRQHIISNQTLRVADFLEANVRKNFEEQLKILNLL